MITAIAGEIATMSNGNSTARAVNRIAAARCAVRSGDASNTTGSNVMPDIDHSGSSRACTTTATAAARTNGAVSAMMKKRRVGAAGHSVSFTAATLGNVTNVFRTIAGAM